MTSRLGKGKSLTIFFTVYSYSLDRQAADCLCNCLYHCTLSVVGIVNTCISLIVLVKVLTDVVSEKVSLVCVEF